MKSPPIVKKVTNCRSDLDRVRYFHYQYGLRSRKLPCLSFPDCKEGFEWTEGYSGLWDATSKIWDKPYDIDPDPDYSDERECMHKCQIQRLNLKKSKY